MHTFTSHNIQYRVLDTGVIEQIAPKPFIYDSSYVATYNTDAYRRGNETLQALRYGFVCAAHGYKPGSILDIGCANGAFMKFAMQHCKDVKGFDIAKAERSGLVIVSEYVRADVYTFWDVLEHIQDCSFLFWLPCDTICVSLPFCHYNYLEQKGDVSFDIKTRNVIASAGLTWFSNNYKHRKPNEHVRHFDEPALQAFMRQYGWHKVAQSTHEDIIRNSEHNLPNILSMAFKRLT